MNAKEILKFCVEKGLLIDPEVLTLFSENVDEESVKLIIEKIRDHTQKRIITKELFEKNREQVSEFFLKLPKENQEKLERFKIKLGLQIEISKESATQIKENISFRSFPSGNMGDTDPQADSQGNSPGKVKILSPPFPGNKKI